MKRVFDFTVSAILIIILTPLMLSIGLIVLFFVGQPIIFTQTRSGKNGKPFTMIKFMTMINLSDDNGNLLKDELRLGKVGKILRAASLDELPTLFNVLIGDMSLVGPRPLLPEYDLLYTSKQAKRLKVLPGITGLAQVSGRNDISWEEKFEYDVIYVESATFLLDLKILFRTLKTVLFAQGVSSKSHVTMERFYGTLNNGKRGKDK